MRLVTLFLLAAFAVSTVDAASYQKTDGTIVDPIMDRYGATHSYSGVNLETGADLEDAELAGAGLTWADLTNANLTGADLTGVDLTGTTLTDATLAAAGLAEPAAAATADLR